MSKPIVIAVDAMGGDNSPKKIIDGISEYLNKDKDIYFRIFGKKSYIDNEISKTQIHKNYFEIVDCEDVVENNDTPLSAAKKRTTSMWKSINDVKEKKSDAIISAGNTGALFVISKLSMKMIENINKPALAALWPNKIDMNIVLDLGANVECDEGAARGDFRSEEPRPPIRIQRHSHRSIIAWLKVDNLRIVHIDRVVNTLWP